MILQLSKFGELPILCSFTSGAFRINYLEPLKQVLSASRDVIFSDHIWGSKSQRVFTLGDGPTDASCPQKRVWCGWLLMVHFPCPNLPTSWTQLKRTLICLCFLQRRIICSRGSAERIWGEFLVLVWRIFGKLPANVSANFDGKFFPRSSRPCFSRASGPPKKFTPKIHGQNSRHSYPISLCFTFFCTPIFCLRARPKSMAGRLRDGDTVWIGDRPKGHRDLL